MEKKTMAKAIFAFVVSMAGTVAGNVLFHHFKDKRDAEKKKQELEEWQNDIPTAVSSDPKPEISVSEIPQTKETVWEAVAKLGEAENFSNVSVCDEAESKADYSFEQVQEQTEMLKEEPVQEESVSETVKEQDNSGLSDRESIVLELHEMFGGNLTTKQIVEQTGISRPTVDRLKKNLIKKGYHTADGKKLKKSPVVIDWNTADSYILNSGKSDREISEMLGCDKSTINKRRAKLRTEGRLSA